MKKREETNVYQVEELLGRAAMMTKYGHVKFRELYTALRKAVHVSSGSTIIYYTIMSRMSSGTFSSTGTA